MATSTRPAQLLGDQTRDFSGGPNQRDAPSELATNEAVDSWNVGYDERGGVQSRLGYVKHNTTPLPGGVVQQAYWSAIANAPLTQAGASIYKGTSTTPTKTFTTADRVDFRDFNGKVFVIHAIDGLFSSPDGVTWTAEGGGSTPKGTSLEVWQNKLWAAGNPANPTRISWSGVADGSTWAPTAFVELRTIDETRVVNLAVASGVDISGRPGLLAFKNESTYRIYDSATGAYEVVDATIGTASSLSVVTIGPRIITLCKHGIYWWAQGRAGFDNASDKLQPLWQPSQIDLGKLGLWAGGRIGERARFSLVRQGSAANDLALEYDPLRQWVAPGSNAFSCYATSTGGSETQYGGSPTISGQAYVLDSGGSDDGAPISWRFQTRWYELNNGFDAFLWQLRVHGRGHGKLAVRRNYANLGGDEVSFDLRQVLPHYDAGHLYDTTVHYAEPADQVTQPLFTLGRARQFSLIFFGSSTETGVGRQVLSQGTAPAVGYFGLYGLEWLYTQLGLA